MPQSAGANAKAGAGAGAGAGATVGLARQRRASSFLGSFQPWRL